MDEADRIGVLLVHGIGDQDRHAHLQAVARDFLTTTVGMFGTGNVSVQIFPGIAGRSELSIIIRATDGTHKVIDFHEMWWRDLGPKASPFNVVQFWAWAATFPGTRGRFYKDKSHTIPPDNEATRKGHVRTWDRVALFFKVTYFFVLLFPLRVAAILINVLPGIRHINLFRTIFTYMSSVQMYQQRRGRKGGTLVDYDQSRRISIQRRFANTLIDMSERGYSRWYVMGHSLGSVIALKGLMTPDCAFASYLSYDRWHHSSMTLRSQEHEDEDYPERPRRPVWLDDVDAIDTGSLYSNFAGLITWGSPLETFAKTWPGMVHVLRHPKFTERFEWLNLYDDVDVISSRLTSFQCLPPKDRPKNISCSSSPWIFSAHTNYFSKWRPRSFGASQRQPNEALIRWMLDGRSPFSEVAETTGFKEVAGTRKLARIALAFSQWLLALAVGLIVWPFAIVLFVRAAAILPRQVMIFLDAGRGIGFEQPSDASTWQSWYDDIVNSFVEPVARLQPTSDILGDIWNFGYILMIVAAILGTGGAMHNLHDYLLEKRARNRKSVVNDEVTYEE